MKFAKYLTYIIIVHQLLIPFAHAADNTHNAEEFVHHNAAKVLSILKETDTHTKPEQLRKLFLEVVDYKWMAKFVLGRYWRMLSPSEKEEYINAYRDYLASIYVSKYEEYNKQTYTIFDSDSLGDNQYQVSMRINLPTSHESVKVTYRLIENGGHFKIIDIIAEGISLITTQRADFSGFLTSHSVKGLIKNLQNKAGKD